MRTSTGRLNKITTWPVLLAVTMMAAVLGGCGTQETPTPQVTQSEANQAVVNRFIEEFKNNANAGIVDELFTPEFVHHLPDPRLPAGREGLKLVGQAIVAGFPDVQVTVEDLLSDGDRVIERTTARATNTGEFNGIPATGKPVTWTEIHIYRMEDGRIAEMWSEIDLLGLLIQLGAVPGP